MEPRGIGDFESLPWLAKTRVASDRALRRLAAIGACVRARPVGGGYVRRRDRRRCVVPVDHATLLSGPSLRAVPVVSWWCGASRRDSGHVPVRRDRALRLGQRLTPGADGAVRIVLQAVLVVGVGRSCRRLGPEVGHAIIAAQFQRDQVVDDIPPPCVMEEAVAPVYRALLAGETASAHELEETSSRLLCPV